MALTISKIRKELSVIKLTTAHARVARDNAVCLLLTYERSISKQEIDLPSLLATSEYIAWLLQHVQTINDKRVLPSQRLFLANAFEHCVKLYEQQRGV